MNENENENLNQGQNNLVQNASNQMQKMGVDKAKKELGKKGKKEVTKKLAGGAAKKSMLAALGPIIAYGSLIVIAIVVIAGVVVFLMTMPGMVMAKLKELAYNIGSGIANYFGSDETYQKVDDDEINILLDYLDDMGYDLKGYGFLTKYMTSSDLSGGDYLDEENGVTRYEEDTEVTISGKTQTREADSIKKAESEFLFMYTVSDNYVYTVKNFNMATYDSGGPWYKKVFGTLQAVFGRIADASPVGWFHSFAEDWGKGMISIYHEKGGKIGVQGDFYEDTWFGWGDNIELDYDKRVLKMKKGLFGSTYEYKLDGWTGRYGVPLDFLLAIHTGTMMPDLAFDLATSFPTEVIMLLHSKTEGEDQFIPYISKVQNHWYRDVYFVDEDKEFVQTDKEYEDLMRERWTLYETYTDGKLNGEYKLYAITSTGEYASDSSQIRNYDKARSKFKVENGMYLFDGTMDEAKELDIAVTKKAKTKNYNADEYNDIGWTNQNKGGVWVAYEEKDGNIKQVGEAMRAETNPLIKQMFLYNTYFRYDGTAETAAAITQLRNENGLPYGALDRTYDLSNGYDELKNYTTQVQLDDGETKVYSIDDVSGRVMLNQDSLNAFSMMENTHTLDADYIYRDFKELVVELGYFTKEELTDETPRLFEWLVPDTGSYKYPYRPLDKRENEFGTYIHSKGDIDVCKKNRLEEIKELYNSPDSDTPSDDDEENQSNQTISDASRNRDESVVIAQNIQNVLQSVGNDEVDANTISKYITTQGELRKLFASDGGTLRADNLVDTAKNCWTYVVEHGQEYSYGPGAVPCNEGRTIDCSAYVSWLLYEYGYEDFKGGQVSSEGFVNTNWNELYGWQEFELGSGENPISYLQPGDIIARHGEGTHHVTFVVEVDGGSIKCFDCGNANNWRCAEAQGGNPVDKSYFLTKVGAGKVIRIEDPGSEPEDYKGYEGNEAVVSPVTGLLLEYGTHSVDDVSNTGGSGNAPGSGGVVSTPEGNTDGGDASNGERYNSDGERATRVGGSEDEQGQEEQVENQKERVNVDLKYGPSMLEQNVSAADDGNEFAGEEVIDEVGYAKIMILDAENYRKLEEKSGSRWANDSRVNINSGTGTAKKITDDPNLKSKDDLKNWNDVDKTVYGYKEFVEKYEAADIAGQVIYIDGFICQDVDENVDDLKKEIPAGDPISINDFKNTDFSSNDSQRPSLYEEDEDYKSVYKDQTDKIEAENQVMKDAVSSYYLNYNGKNMIFIKEGTVLGRTMSDKELLEAPYLRNGSHGTYDEIRKSDNGENDKVIGNYLRIIYRDSDDTVVENVEDYMKLDEPGEKKGDQEYKFWDGDLELLADAIHHEGCGVYDDPSGGHENQLYLAKSVGYTMVNKVNSDSGYNNAAGMNWAPGKSPLYHVLCVVPCAAHGGNGWYAISDDGTMGGLKNRADAGQYEYCDLCMEAAEYIEDNDSMNLKNNGKYESQYSSGEGMPHTCWEQGANYYGNHKIWARFREDYLFDTAD